jgi:hypothetical protein
VIAEGDLKIIAQTAVAGVEAMAPGESLVVVVVVGSPALQNTYRVASNVGVLASAQVLHKVLDTLVVLDQGTRGSA